MGVTISIIIVGVLLLISMVALIVLKDLKKRSVESTPAPPPPAKAAVYDPSLAMSFDEDYQDLFDHFKKELLIKPDKHPYAFYALSTELLLKFILLGLNNSESDIKNAGYGYKVNLKSRSKDAYMDDWESLIIEYNQLRNRSGVRLSDYVYNAYNAYVIALTSNLIFKGDPILNYLSNYSAAATLIAKQAHSDAIHNDRYGSAIILYYTLHMQTVVKILENQKQNPVKEPVSQAYLKYLEDELGLTKFTLDEEDVNFIISPSSLINTDVTPQCLVKGMVTNA